MRRLAAPILAPLAVGLATVALIGCGGGSATTATVQAREESLYLQRARALIDPPTELAGLVSAQLGAQPGPIPADSLLEALLDRTRRALADLRTLPLVNRGLRLQRGRLVAGFPAIVAQMGRLIDDLERVDRRALRAHALPLARSLKGLPSALDGRSSSR
jgi:hypothetical protein